MAALGRVMKERRRLALTRDVDGTASSSSPMGSRPGVWLVVIVAGLIGIAVVFFGLGRVAPTADPTTPTGAAPVPGQGVVPTDRAAQAAGATRSPGGEADDGIPITQLPLLLVATATGDEVSNPFARIEDLQHAVESILHTGQALPERSGVVLASIERESVLLDNHGDLERLPLDANGRALGADDLLGPPVEQGAARSEAEIERRRALAERLRERVEAGADRDAVRARGGLLAEAEIGAVYEDGELVGVRLREIRPGSVYDRAGLRGGDVVTGINGVSVGDESAAANLIAELAGSETLEVSLRRADGSEQTISLPTRDLLGALEAIP